MNFGERLKFLRTQRDKTQDELAKILNVKRVSLSNWETGRASPGYTMLKKLASYFNVTVDYLLNGEPLKVAENGLKYLVLSEEDREFLVKVKELPDEDREMLDSLVEHLRRKKGVNEEAAGNDNIRPFRHRN